MNSAWLQKLLFCGMLALLIPTVTLAQTPGAEMWVRRWGGPAETEDRPVKVAVDSVGNVIVAGYSSRGVTPPAPGPNMDWLIIKYTNGGTPLWTNRYTRCSPGYCEALLQAMAVDNDDNVFVTGTAAGDFATIKYSPAGVPLWTNIFTGPGQNGDTPQAMAVDGNGNVFVTGDSYALYDDYRADLATVGYSSAGDLLWTNRVQDSFGNRFATALAVGGEGNVFVTGTGSTRNFLTLKYSGNGALLWSRGYSIVNDNDQPRALAVDRDGNVFVTGEGRSGGVFDYLTISYSNDGFLRWGNRYRGPGSGDNRAWALAVDGTSGNVIVTGYSPGAGTFLDYATVAYSSWGDVLWEHRYDGPANGYDWANAVAVDGGGNVFVSGFSPGNGSAHDYATLAYSSAGVPLWTNRYNGPANHDDFASAMAVDKHGNVFVTGYSWNGTSYDLATVKYASVREPALTIALTTTNTIAISWPAPATGFVLEENTELATTNWIPVSITPTDDGTTKSVVLSPSTGNRFYRLQRP